MDHPFPLFLALPLSVRRFQMSLEGLSFEKMLATLGNYLRHRPTSSKYGWDRLPPLTCLRSF